MYNSKDTDRVGEIISLLKVEYPNAKIVLKYKNTWQLLVSVILSAQCTDVTVNKVTSRLFTKYKKLGDYVNADITQFEKDIKSTGFYRNKAKNILASARRIQTVYGGSVPSSMKDLLTLPGVARKTANVVIGNAFNTVEGIAVDTHVHRISQRLRLVSFSKIGGKKVILFTKYRRTYIDYRKDADPEKIERELMKIVPKTEWVRFTYLVIEHGRAICKAQNPRCQSCKLSSLCPASRITSV